MQLVVVVMALLAPAADATAATAAAAAPASEPASAPGTAPLPDLGPWLPVSSALTKPADTQPLPPATPLPPLPPLRCKLAVFDLQHGEGYSEKTAIALSDVVTAEVARHSTCSVLSRTEIRSILSFEAEKQLLGCDDESCLAELAGALGVDFLISGSLGKVGDSTVLTLRNINLRTLTVERRLTDTFAGEGEDLVLFAGWMARRLYLEDATAGRKPIAHVRRGGAMSTWRLLAWTGVGVSTLAALITLGAAGTTYGLSYALERLKTSKPTDSRSINDIEKYGPIAPQVANAGLYLTPALVLASIVLFVLPADDAPAATVSSPAQTGAASPNAERP